MTTNRYTTDVDDQIFGVLGFLAVFTGLVVWLVAIYSTGGDDKYASDWNFARACAPAKIKQLVPADGGDVHWVICTNGELKVNPYWGN